MAGPVRGQRVSETMQEAARRLRSQQTPAEHHLWGHLRAGRLDGISFRRQQPIGPCIADFYCSAARLVIEADGAIHAEQLEYDQERDAYLAAYDPRVLRFTNDAVLHETDTVLATIRRATATP